MADDPKKTESQASKKDDKDDDPGDAIPEDTSERDADRESWRGKP